MPFKLVNTQSKVTVSKNDLASFDSIPHFWGRFDDKIPSMNETTYIGRNCRILCYSVLKTFARPCKQSIMATSAQTKRIIAR